MPRVASETPSVSPSRSQPVSARSPSETRSKPAASPFTEMLDSAAPSAEPAFRQTRTESPERADRTDKPKSTEPKPKATKTDGRSTDSNPSRRAGADDSKAATGHDDAKTTPESKNGAADDGKDAKADGASAGPDSNPISGPGSAVDVTFGHAASLAAAVPAVPLLAGAADGAGIAETEGVRASRGIGPLADLPAAGNPGTSPEAGVASALPTTESLQASSAAAPKPLQGPRVAPASAQDQGPEKGDAPASSTGAETSQIESAKDSEPSGGDDKAAAKFHRAFADLTAKLASDGPAADRGDAPGAARASADSAQNAGVLTPANAPSAPAAVGPAQPQAQAAAVPLAGLAVEIVSQAHAGKNHFEIRLDPPELGRIDVKLDVDRDGNVSTRLVVDRSDTLDLLKRDASSLERALAQAGLKTSDHGLDFSLRQHSFAEQQAAAQPGARVVVPNDDPVPLEALRQGYGRLLGLGGGLDIRV